MAKDEYQIPNEYNETAIRAQIDAIQQTPEHIQPAPYQGIKNIESKISSYRESALLLEKKRKGWLSGLVFSPANNTLGDLIEKESNIGGKLFGKGNKFWLDAKSNSTVFHNDVADWYHSRVNPANPKRPIVLRFQTTPNSIHKLYDGREYAPTIQDLEILTKAIEAYAEAVLPLYPIDQALHDFEHEADDNTASRAA